MNSQNFNKFKVTNQSITRKKIKIKNIIQMHLPIQPKSFKMRKKKQQKRKTSS